MPKKLYPVCKASELLPGGRRIVDADGKSIGVFNVRGEYFALRNLCPHQLAPLCEGRITGTNAPGGVGEFHWVKDGEIIRCPWHGWEFDIKTGQSVFNPHKLKAGSYHVKVLDACGKAIDRVIDAGEGDPAVEKFRVRDVDGTVFLEI